MKIGICDDNIDLCAILREQLIEKSYITSTTVIEEYHSAEELLEANPSLDLLFLDIEMPGMSGVELLRQHKDSFSSTHVVFLTSHEEYARDGYELNLYRYLTKPIQDEKLEELFQSLEDQLILNKELSFQTDGTIVHLLLKDLISIESKNNYCHFSTLHDTFKIYMRLKDILPDLPEKFFAQTHKSFVVNMNYITHVDLRERMVYLTNNTKAEISYRKSKEFDEKYIKFLAGK